MVLLLSKKETSRDGAVKGGQEIIAAYFVRQVINASENPASFSFFTSASAFCRWLNAPT